MAIDPMIKQAITTAVQEAGQPIGVAQRFVRWFEAVSSGSEDLANAQSASGHLDALFESTEVAEITRGIVIDVSDI